MVPPRRFSTPFPFEGPVPPDLLIDREDELSLLGRRAADRVHVRLVAPRRYGKTSLLLAHAQALREAGWRAVHVDFSRVADVTDVARRIAAAYAELDSSWMRSHLSGLLSRLGVTLSASGPAVSVGPRPMASQPAVAESVLAQMLDLPRSLWERELTPTLVVLDEFQDLLVARDDLDGLLRSRIQYHGEAAAYIYAGSAPSMMRELFEERERPLFGQADPLTLGRLPEPATMSDLYDRFESEGLAPGDALPVLVTFAAGHPQRTMLLAYLLADRLGLGDAGTPALASAVIDDALRRTGPAHQTLWTQLGRSERNVLAGIADGMGPSSRLLASEHRVGRSTLNSAADRLADQGHLVREGRTTRIVDPLLAEWVRRR